MDLDHAEDYGSTTAARNAVSAQLGMFREALRRWVDQAQVDVSARDGVSSTESDELKALEAENKGLREANEILRQVSIVLAREPDPHRR